MKMLSLTRKGYSLVSWTVTFALVVAGLFFIQSPLKRTLWTRAMAFSDYFLWGNQTFEYGGETATFTKTFTQQQQVMRRTEDHQGQIKLYSSVPTIEATRSMNVEEGAEVLAKTFDLNQELPTAK